MNIKIIVSRYNEDVSWTKQFPNVTIINKGNKLYDDYNQIFYKNVGREAHSYYQYIYDNYDSLDDYIVFLQGNPFDHSPHIIKALEAYIHTERHHDITFAYLSELYRETTLQKEKSLGMYIKNIDKTYEHLFGFIKETPIVKCWGAQFIVSKKYILTKSKLFYKKIIELLNTSINPKEAYELERIHHEIFSYNEYTHSFDTLPYVHILHKK